MHTCMHTYMHAHIQTYIHAHIQTTHLSSLILLVSLSDSRSALKGYTAVPPGDLVLPEGGVVLVTVGNSSSNDSLAFRLLRRESNFESGTFSDRPSVMPDGGTVSSALVLAADVDTCEPEGRRSGQINV